MTNNIDEILQLSKEDLYAILEADDDVNVDISLDELSSTDYTQFADSEWNIEVSPRIKLSPQFLGVGKKSLKKIWKAVLTIICKIYKENPSIGDRDLIDAVVIALGISGSWATALVALALKLGLKNICK